MHKLRRHLLTPVDLGYVSSCDRRAFWAVKLQLLSPGWAGCFLGILYYVSSSFEKAEKAKGERIALRCSLAEFSEGSGLRCGKGSLPQRSVWPALWPVLVCLCHCDKTP